jgi:hypothetical protein
LAEAEAVVGVAELLEHGCAVAELLDCSDALEAAVLVGEKSEECVSRALAVKEAARVPTGHTVAVALELVLRVAPALVLGGAVSDALLLGHPETERDAEGGLLTLLCAVSVWTVGVALWLRRALLLEEGAPDIDSDAASENVRDSVGLAVTAVEGLGLAVAAVEGLVESVPMGVSSEEAVPPVVLEGEGGALGVAELLEHGCAVAELLDCSDALEAAVLVGEKSEECVSRALAVTEAARVPTEHTVAVALELVLGVVPVLALGDTESEALLVGHLVPKRDAEDWPLTLFCTVLLSECETDADSGALVVGHTVEVADGQK